MFLQNRFNLNKLDLTHYMIQIIDISTIASEINGTPKGVRLSEKVQLTTTLSN